MRRRLRRGYIAIVMMMATVGLFLLTLVSPVLSTSTDFSIYNSGWNGTSDIARATYELGSFVPTLSTQASDTDMTIVHVGLQEFNLDPSTDTLMVLGPSRTFTESDGAVVREFVYGGGVLVLADDFGTGNSLLEAIGASSRFSGRLMLDLSFDRRPEFSVCFSLNEDPLTTGVSKLLLNHPSSVSVSGPNSTVVAESSIASWLDVDGDSVRDVSEPRGPFPVVVRERMGSGRIILVSDPSILINGMVTQLDNGVFARNLVSVACDHRTSVFFDESHRVYFDPVAVTTQITGDVSFITKLHILVVACALLIWVSTDLVDRAVLGALALVRSLYVGVLRLLGRRVPEVDRGPAKSQEEILRELSDRHPEWRLGLIRHVMSERERHSEHVRKMRSLPRQDLVEAKSEATD